MKAHGQTERDRRVALGWIGRQLAWENRLQSLREDPAEEPADRTDEPEETEVGSAA
jgi:hypothetical protein